MLDSMINKIKFVSDNSKYVKINEEKVLEFANNIKDIKHGFWLGSSPFNILDLDTRNLINFLLIFESIDFSFWGDPKWNINISEKQEDGSIALLYCLLKYFKETNNLEFYKLSKKEFKNILKGNGEIPLLDERYNIVCDISKIVKEKMNNDFYEFIKDIRTDIELFNIITSNFKDFTDERTYKGEKVYFYKLAQLLVSDISNIRKIKENIEIDHSHLIGAADYKIPQVMRAIGMLEYNKELANIIDNKIQIMENSEYEVEIRANMLIVIDKIKKYLNYTVCAMDINDYIWGLSRNKNLEFKPYHLTRTTSY